MVNMIGFHHKEPTYNTAAPGQPGFSIRRIDKPMPEYPLRAKMFSPTAWALFIGPEDAEQYLDHPGAIPYLARAYLSGNTDVCPTCWLPHPLNAPDCEAS